MATRYYLPSSGAAAVSPAINADWGIDDFASVVALVSTKSNTALTDMTDTPSGVAKYLFRQYVSARIGVVNFNTTTVSLVVRCARTPTNTTKLRVNIRLYHPDTTFTTLLSPTDFDSAFGTAATRIINASALANVSSQNNDRLVVEIGANCSAYTTGTVIERFGDVSATSDFALTSALTTDLDPWIEFSANIPAPSNAAFFKMLK